MSESVHTNTSLWSNGMKAVIVAQFLSAFGDNVLLFATLALLKAGNDSNLLIVFYVQIMPDDFVMQLHRF